MSNSTEPNISIKVDVTNPGQFFACCGLLELADRLWRGAEGWFGESDSLFCIACDGTFSEIIASVAAAELTPADPEDRFSSPVIIGKPFRELCVDWWKTDITGARDLKVWAGSMESFGIARAMQQALKDEIFHGSDIFDVGVVVMNADEPSKKKEPFYFDARRAINAHSRDIGFSPNDLSLTTVAHPAVELLCLVGIQVARPAATSRARVYDYFTWSVPLPSNLLLAASTGSLELPCQRGYRFENWFRTGQKKHKAFRYATPILKE